MSNMSDSSEDLFSERLRKAPDDEEVLKNRMLRCTVCSRSLQASLLKGRNLYHHPVLKVLMCKKCFDFYGDGNFSADEDGSDRYCRWCGQGGMLYCCSVCGCAFCKSCIKRNLGRSLLIDIEAEDWKCFVCNGEPLLDLRDLCANAESYSEKIKRVKQCKKNLSCMTLKMKALQSFETSGTIRPTIQQYISEDLHVQQKKKLFNMQLKATYINKQSENQNNRKQVQLKDKQRQLCHRRKHSLVDSSSSDDASSSNEQESYRNRCKRNDANAVHSDGRRKGGKKQNLKSSDSVMEIEVPNSGKKVVCVQLSDCGENEKKMKNGPLTDKSTLPIHLDGSSSDEEVSTDSSRKKKRQGRKSKIRCTQTIKEGSWISGGAVGTDRESESNSKQEHSNGGCKDLPEELDKESAKLACQLLEKCCRDLVDVGEVLVLRAKRCVEKKVGLKAMANPKNVDKVVNSLQLLMKLAGDNLQHIGGFLSLSHRHWVQGVVKRSSTKTGGDVGNEDKLKTIVTKQGSVDGNMSMNGIGDDDIELHSLSENDSDNGKIENETAKGQSDICADSDRIKETIMEKSEKRKFKKEWNGSDDSEVVVDTDENEGNSQKSVMRDKKRRKLEDGLEMQIGEVVDPDTRTSENCKGDSDYVMKGSSNQTVTELRDELGEETVKDISTDATENGGDSEVKKVSDRNKSLSVGSEEREEGNVAEKKVEDVSLLHEASDRLFPLETDPDDNSTVWSKSGFESLSTLQLVDYEQNSQESQVSDILIDPEKSIVHVEETLQQNSCKKSDEGLDYEQLNAGSERKLTHPVKNNGDLAATDEDSKNDDSGDVAVVSEGSKNDDGDLAAVDEDIRNNDSDALAAVDEGCKSDNSDTLTAAGEGSKSDDSGDLAAVDEDSRNNDSDALAAVDEGCKSYNCDTLTAAGEGSKSDDSGDLAAVDEDSRNNDSDALAAVDEGCKSYNCDTLTAAGEGSKSDDSGDLAAVDEDSRNNDSDALAAVDEGCKSYNCDTLAAAGEGSKSDDSGDLAAVDEDSRNNDSDALAVVDEGCKSYNCDTLTAAGEGSKNDESDTLTAVGEGSKSDDSDALTAVGEGSKNENSNTLTAVGEGSTSDDNDALTAVGEDSKGDGSDALTAVSEGSTSDDSDALPAVGEGSKSDGSDALTTVGEGSKSEEDKNNSDSDAETIECLFSDAGEKSLSDEDGDNEKNEKVTSADNLNSIKKHPEENKETDGEVKIDEDKPVSLEVPDSVKKDSVATGYPYITVRDIKELLMEKYVTESNENSGEENKMNTCEDLEKDIGKKDEVKGRLENDEKQRSSDMGRLKLNDTSECEQDEKDSVEDTIEIDEDNTAAEDKIEEGATDALKYTAECMKAQQSVLAYTTDNEDTSSDTLPEKKKRKKHSRKTKQEVAALKHTKPAKKQRIGPKSQPHEGISTASSSVSSTDIDSECSIGRNFTKLKEGGKQKFRLKDTEAYKQDEKLQWKCTVLVKRLRDEVFRKHYEGYCTDGEDGSEKKAKANNEIHSLVNLQSLKKRRANKCDTEDSDTEDSIDVGKKKSKKITKKDRNKEQEQKLINFFNQMDDDDDSMSTCASDSEEEAMKTLRTKKNFLQKESEMVMKALLASSTDGTDTDSSEKKESPEENKKKKIKPKEKTDGTEAVTKKEEEREQEIKEEKADSCPNNGDVSSEDSEVLKRKRKWRRDKLLTARLSDLDTSDEERRWKTKKEKEQKKNDDDSEEKNACEMTPRKKKLRRRVLGSDEDSDIIISSSEDSSDDFVRKRKKPAKKSNSGKDSTSDTDTGRKKVKRRRIKAPADDSSSSEGGQVECSQKSDTPGKGRKNIHRIMKDADVGEATRRAGREEEERKKRISEKQKLYNEMYKEVEGVQVFDKLVLDFDPETKEELVAVDPYIVSKLKPHQVKGVKFMWDACFESVKQIKKTKGSGCILAHCMGLGKTLQVVALVHTLLKHKDTKVHTVLVVCPLSTVLNWVNEFNMWLKDIGNGEEVNVFELSKYKQNYERMYQLKEWQNCGGVMVMGYDMFRNLTNAKAARIRKKAIETFQSTLIDPGPDLVVCDEGHMLKNEDTALSKAMNRITTLCRIVLTGTPLQNNLKEYHCMVQFVKPNLLGTQKEFRNRFMNPISNGQFEDSTAHDVKIMKRRAHVLHKMLEGSIQRFDYSVLTPFLPPKHEYVISIRLSDIQIKAYQYYLENCAMGKSGVNFKGAQLFSDYQNLSRIWTHPRVLQMSTETAEKNAEKKRLMESDSEGSLRDFIDDGDDDGTETTESSGRSSSDESDVQVIAEGEKKVKSTRRNTRSTRSKGLVEEPEVNDVDEVEKSKPLAWWKQFIEGDELENIKFSGKLVLLFAILQECEKIGDKVLVFSQSLYSLDLIEYFLACVDTATQASETKESLDNNTGSWSLGLDYFRLDGSTSAENRNVWCKAFNREDNHRARLFIISTRAGGLGINLFAANRVIVFDASWNPSHDVQSIFRVYRFGQKKPCYIYRFLAQGTMEEKIYDRQVTKLSLSCRVVDEQQIERHYNMADLQELYKFSPEEKTKRPTPILPKDRLLAELLKEHEQWIVTYHEHDSLLENKEEEELNEEERKAAWEDYENEKKGKLLPAPGIVFNAARNLNLPALRETLRKENPHATEEELDLRLSIVVNQIYEYVNSSKNGMPSSNVQYTAAHAQALRQYQMQQEQLLRAQQQEQQRLQQQNVMWPVPGNYPTSDMSFRQYLQNQTNLNSGVFPTNLYRNVAVDRPGVFRMQQKLVPFNPPGSSSRTVIQKVGGNMGGPEVISRLPMMLPRLPARTQQPPFAPSSSRVNQRQDVLAQYDAQQLRGNATSVPHDVIETID